VVSVAKEVALKGDLVIYFINLCFSTVSLADWADEAVSRSLASYEEAGEVSQRPKVIWPKSGNCEIHLALYSLRCFSWFHNVSTHHSIM